MGECFIKILTHLAYIANGKKRVILCNTTNVISVCKYQHYSQIFGGISAMQWRKAERYQRFQQHLFRLLCVRIEIDQLKCVNC